MNAFSRFLAVPTTDPDDTRRRRILNILVASVGILSLLAIVISLISVFFTGLHWESVSLIIVGSLVTIIGMVIVYLINIF